MLPLQQEKARLAQLGQEAVQKRDLKGALAIYEESTKRFPKWALAHLGLGSVLMLQMQFERARKSLELAARFDPKSAAIQIRLAELTSRMGLVVEADKHASRALELEPRNMHAALVKADILRTRGSAQDAADLLEPLLQSDHPAVVAKWGAVAGRSGRLDDAIARLEHTTRQPIPDTELLAGALFELGLLYERAERYDDAFLAVNRANELQPKQYDAPREDRRLTDWLDMWSSDRMAGLARSRSRSEVPVFVVGMPRSGTSLVEQIIASHPEGAGAGELTTVTDGLQELIAPTESEPTHRARLDGVKPAALDRVGRHILRHMSKITGSRAQRICDKMPQNFMNIGFIEQLFPSARIIHCRRDPLDTCVSCYFLSLGGPHNAFHDLTSLAHYYRGYERAMAHWRTSSGLAMLEISYEELVSDQEAQTHALIEFLGLEWHDDCLTPHETTRTVATHSTEQVRQPMYSSSIGRWRRYEQHLAPLRDALAEG